MNLLTIGGASPARSHFESRWLAVHSRAMPGSSSSNVHRAAAALFLLLVLTSSTIASAGTIILSPGDNIQSAVNLNLPGTIFVLKPGIYRLQAVVPKSGDVFWGRPGTTLNGSRIVTNWQRHDLYWTSIGDPALNTPWAKPGTKVCNDATSACAYPQDLFLNNKPLVHKLRLPLTAGEWYFDYDADIIYMADNPAGNTVELSVAQKAFSGSAGDVRIQDLTVEKYAAPILLGAICPQGPDWTINSNDVRLNHSAGIKPFGGRDHYEHIFANNVHDNGQEGIALGGGVGTVIENNLIAANNYANVSDGFEEGGGKIAGSTNTHVLNNTYSNNNGVGLWADSDATGSILAGNTVKGSRLDGIRFEISHYGTISNNTLINNGQYHGTGPCTSGGVHEIALAQSDHVTVVDNIITSNCAGIIMTSGARNLAFDDVVEYNVTTYSGPTGIANLIGGLDSNIPPTLYDPAYHNYYDYNIYHFVWPAGLALKNWTWNGTPVKPLRWSEWRAAGEDLHGSADYAWTCRETGLPRCLGPHQ